MVVYLGRCPRLYTSAPTARVDHSGSHVASWTLSLAMFGAVGNALSVHVAHTWVLMGITENVGTDMLIVETDLYVFRSRL